MTLSDRIVALINSKPIAPTSAEIDDLIDEHIRNWTAHKHRMAEILILAKKLSEPFVAANPTIEYDGWIDNCTDNILFKVYSRPRNEAQPRKDDPEYGLAYALTRRAIEDGDNLPMQISEGWSALTHSIKLAIDRKEQPRTPDATSGRWPILGLAEAKLTGGESF